ncbi:MAG: methionyl-tRNA formyltransferase [Anaerovoracaceae bacterium]
MKIMFMGTPEFAVPTLSKLQEAGHTVDLVVSQPDAARDRGKKTLPTPVKEKALALGATVLQPEKIKNNPEFMAQVEEYAPDLIVVVAYGKILPKELLVLPPLGCVNVHGSILPRYRGAAPIQHAILDGEEETGVTIMYMEEGLDTGDMLSVARTPIEKKTAEDLHDELSVMGAELLVKTIVELEEGKIVPQKQEDSLSTYAPMIAKKDGEIDFSQPAQVIERKVRGFYPWPGAYTHLNGTLFKIWEADVDAETVDAPPGSVVAVSDKGIVVATGEGRLICKVIQLPGKKKVSVQDFIRGNSIELSTILG